MSNSFCTFCGNIFRTHSDFVGHSCSKENKRFKPFQVVVFDPEYGKTHPEAYSLGLIQIGESVLFLGEIPNVPGHCAVAKHNGSVIWLCHTDEFREPTEEEL